MTISVVIPTLNAEPYMVALLEALAGQQPRPPDEVILVDSHSTDATVSLAENWGARVLKVDVFTHGGARNMGAQAATGDVVVFMTQDALPRDEHWLAHLVEAFNDDRVAASFSRQVPKEEATPMEAYYLKMNFPEGRPVRRMAQAGEAVDAGQVFFSNVSSAVRREILLRLPFDETLIMGEDQQLARDILSEGLATEYRPHSVVIHSHRYPLRILFKRYFDSAVAMKSVVQGHTASTSTKMGLSYLRHEAGHILRHHPLWLPYYLGYLVAKAGGVYAGHLANRLPMSWRRKLSLHAYHWKQ